MNQYERKNVERIINEIKEMEKAKPMSEVKKAYYLYLNLGEIYRYKVNYMYADSNTYEKRKAKERLYEEGTSEDGEAICTDMNRTYSEALEMLGIESHLSYTDSENSLSHVDCCFKDKEGNYYFANLVSDIMHIKTGMKTRSFGLSEEQLKNVLYDKNPEKNRLFHLFRMHKENEGKEFMQVREEQIKQWDEEFGYTYHGLYTNDIIQMLSNEILDDKYAMEFFGTDKRDELIQKKLEFIMDKLKIVNVHRRKMIGDVEAMEYYRHIARNVFNKEEAEKYIKLYQGFVEENGIRNAKNILVIQKEKENLYYLYSTEKQIFEKIDKEQLLRQKIQYHNVPENRIDYISTVINELEKRVNEKEQEER